MKEFYTTLLLTITIFFNPDRITAQSCSPQGNPAVYGTNNVWTGYVYQGMNFNIYKGYINRGTASSMNFDESFGGNTVNFATNGCSVYTDTFSVRFRLQQNFNAAYYSITVGGDDGYRLSIDGGATWLINNWTEHSYTTSTVNVYLSGNTNLVLEYYERYVNNRVSFNITAGCNNGGVTTTYGTNNQWIGYLYEGTNFQSFRGSVTEGTASSPNFDQNFGGSNVSYNTSGCPLTTRQFSARYRLNTTLSAGTYSFTVRGDDGFRLSLDGGNTYVINRWTDQSFSTATYTADLSGTYNMVLEYYENDGDNRLSFNMARQALLPVVLTGWSAEVIRNSQVKLTWETGAAENFDHFTLQRSYDGSRFESIANVDFDPNNNDYSYTDANVKAGVAYYRLVMVDKDGKQEFSRIIAARMQTNNNISMYPTLVTNNSFVVSSGQALRNVTVSVFDMNGRTLFVQKIGTLQGERQINLGGPKLNPGTYVAILSQDGAPAMKQLFMVQ